MDLVECPPKIQRGNTIEQTSLQALRWACIWDVLTLNLGQNTGYHYQGIQLCTTCTVKELSLYNHYLCSKLTWTACTLCILC